MNKNISFNFFDSKEELVDKLSSQIAIILKDAIIKDGKALIALSGGSTPKELFKKLSIIDLEWGRVFISLVDERWIEPTHQDSNERLVKDFLMQNYATKANFISLKSDESTPYESESSCSKKIDNLKKEFDVVVLGMGSDGHTASFFPQAKTLSKALTSTQSCVATTPLTAPYDRMTLSLFKLLKSQNIFLHIEGEKREVYNQALENGEIQEMPIRSFLRASKNLEVYYAK